MGWLGDMMKKLGGAAPAELAFVRDVPATGIAGIGEPIAPDECYIELYVESLRLEKARRFATRFNGVVYSFASLAREADDRAQFAAMTKPERLTEVDPNAAANVITLSRKMMGPVPWRGGELRLELGLFSVAAGNLLTPVVDYVAKVSELAGVSFVGAVKPFLPLITEGMDLIAGQRNDTSLEVGVDTDLQPAKTAMYAIVAAPRDTVDGTRLSIDPQDRRLLADGRALDRGYCVWSIRATKQKADYGEIPELKERYAALQDAIRANDIKRAQDAMAAFRLAAIASPDLITSDAARLVQKAEQKLKAAFPGGGIAAKPPAAGRPETLSQIGLYG